jgi:hypothetical protein
MGYNIVAYSTISKELIATISFGYGSDMETDFLALLKVKKSTVRRIYTVTELRQLRKQAVNLVKDQQRRREVKAFLTGCINGANESSVDILFA